ncbi:MAG: FAD/NAD(P)-binding protein [Candidatus Omnitrophota bacterium]|nr:FAD/NAD(P)-binding protein [Candidatus Omnitrophota bacterium]
MKNPYLPIEAVIKDIRLETNTIKTFRIRPKEAIDFKTGQFVQLSVPGFGEAPFTPSSNPANKDEMEITIMKAGKITSILDEISSGESLGIRGPFGKGYPIEEFKGKEILIVGGGVGLAPLRSLLFTLFSCLNDYPKLAIRYGARTPSDIVYKESIPLWQKKDKVDFVLTVDIGDATWSGNVGLVTTILKDLPLDCKEAKAVVCGPPIMMKFTTFKLLDQGFKPDNIYLSMEKNMSCGLGKCGHCRLGRFYVCKDGPVLTLDKIKDMPDIWD